MFVWGFKFYIRAQKHSPTTLEIGYVNQNNVKSIRLKITHHRRENGKLKDFKLYGPVFEVINISTVNLFYRPECLLNSIIQM